MNEFTIKKEKHIQYIIDDFDFEKINKIMVALDWKWYDNGKFYIPTENDLKKCARRLLSDVCLYDCDIMSTGGFCAKRKDDYLRLEFIVEEQSSNIMNLDTPNYEKLKKLKERENKLNTINKIVNNEND